MPLRLYKSKGPSWVQRIRFDFDVRVKPGYVKQEFVDEVRRKIEKITGVEQVEGRWFRLAISIVRPQEESGKDISNEIKTALRDINGVHRVREISWSRY